MDVKRASRRRGKYPLLRTDTEVVFVDAKTVRKCSTKYDFKRTSFIPGTIKYKYLREPIPRELLGGELEKMFGVWVANQSTPSTLSTVLVQVSTKRNFWRLRPRNFVSLTKKQNNEKQNACAPNCSNFPLSTRSHRSPPHGLKFSTQMISVLASSFSLFKKKHNHFFPVSNISVRFQSFLSIVNNSVSFSEEEGIFWEKNTDPSHFLWTFLLHYVLSLTSYVPVSSILTFPLFSWCCLRTIPWGWYCCIGLHVHNTTC